MDKDIRDIYDQLDQLKVTLFRVKVLASWILRISILGWLLWLMDAWLAGKF